MAEIQEAELSADDWADMVRHRALRVKITNTICHAIEVERVADALRSAALEAKNIEPQFIEQTAVEENAALIVPSAEDLNRTRFLSESTIGRPKENVIAASISDLYDRLGGFIKHE